MPKNPSLSLATTARGAGMPHQDGLNNSQSYNNEGYNTFDRSNLRLVTTRFADIVPYGCQIAVDGDVIRKRNAFDLSTYTMKSRLLTDVNLSLDSFTVPLSAIMPNTWKLVIKQPLKGNDIADSVYPYIDLTDILDACVTFESSNPIALDSFRYIVAMSGILGHYGLLKHLGYSSPYSDYFDDLYSDMVGDLMGAAYVIDFKDRDGNTYQFGTGQNLSALCGLLDRYWKGEIEITSIGTFVPSLGGTSLSTLHSVVKTADGTESRTVDMRKVFAYQMSCAQFYSNSHIDDIYSGELWLQNLTSIFNSGNGAEIFTLNGVSYTCDLVCNRVMQQCLNGSFFVIGASDWFAFVSNVFALRSSLRMPDYFTCSRLTQFAVFDSQIAVNNNAVSVIDVNEREWYQRFANAVNRGSQEINSYLERMFGIQRQRIEPQPNFVCHEEFPLGQTETENTGSAQVSDPDSVTTRMARAQSNFQYEIFIDEPETVVLSLMSCTAKYVYPEAIDKDFDTQNRYDMFQTMLQHVGDQEVKVHELDCNTPYDKNFGFQLRYAQYKNAIDHAAGGFSRGVLPSWAMLWPTTPALRPPVWTTNLPLNALTPEFIRNHNDDFDQFYQSLTGQVPSERFHFIVKVFNAVLNNSKQQAYPTLT